MKRWYFPTHCQLSSTPRTAYSYKVRGCLLRACRSRASVPAWRAFGDGAGDLGLLTSKVTCLSLSDSDEPGPRPWPLWRVTERGESAAPRHVLRQGVPRPRSKDQKQFQPALSRSLVRVSPRSSTRLRAARQASASHGGLSLLTPSGALGAVLRRQPPLRRPLPRQCMHPRRPQPRCLHTRRQAHPCTSPLPPTGRRTLPPRRLHAACPLRWMLRRRPAEAQAAA